MPAVCIDIPGWPDFPPKPPLTISTKAEVFPQFCDTLFKDWLDPMQNIHSYDAAAGEKVEFRVDAGLCTWDVCSRCTARPPICEREGHGTVDVYIEVLDEFLIERKALYTHH